MKANYLASPPLVVAYALAGRMDVDLVTEPLGHDAERRAGLPLGPLAVTRGGPRDGRRQRSGARCSSARTPTSTPATRSGASCRCPRARCSRGRTRRPTCGSRRTSRAWTASRARVEDIAGARCLVSLGDSVTTDHISPAGSIKPDCPGRAVPRRARRRARGLQLVRLAPREPRGDGARHVRERPPAEPARPGRGGHVDGASPVGRRGDDLRGGGAVPRRRRADDRARRQGVRLGLVARLGGEGAEPPRRAGRDRRELRADPPLEPADDGDPPAPVPPRREPRVARAHRPRGVRGHRASRTARRAR